MIRNTYHNQAFILNIQLNSFHSREGVVKGGVNQEEKQRGSVLQNIHKKKTKYSETTIVKSAHILKLL